MKRTFSAVAFSSVLLFTVAVGCAQYTSVTTETHSIPENSTMEVSTFNGSISVEWYEGSELILEITTTSNRSEEELDKVEVEVTTGMLTSIKAIRLDRDASVGVSLNLRLPEGTEITELQTSNGRIAVIGGSGSASAHTGNGSIYFEDYDGFVSAETSNGSITVSGGSLVYAVSSNGSITGEINSIPPDGIAYRTSNGAIKVEISSELNADIKMDTSNGSITVTGNGFSNLIIDDSDGTATLGYGGNPVILTTSNGSISVAAN